MPGVVSSSVGYVGGTTQSPTYRSVCAGDGHTEALRLEFDPNVISYEELMRLYFSEAYGGRSKPQYMSAVWAQSDEQAATANKIARASAKEDIPVLATSQWHDAEDYHQKYLSKGRF